LRNFFLKTLPAGGRWPDDSNEGGRALPPFTWFRIHHRTPAAGASLFISLDGPAQGDPTHDYEVIAPGERRVRNVAAAHDSPAHFKELNLLNKDVAPVVVAIEIADSPIVDFKGS
jgi:hypothetical protein